MTAPRINAIVETCLHVQDLARSVRFYRDILGLRVIEEVPHRLCACSIADKQLLLLFQSGGTAEPFPTPGGLVPPHGGAGQLHVGFAVSKEDYAVWRTHLPANGVPIESEVSWPAGGQSLYFRDPDFHLLELVTPGLWEIY